MLAFAAAIALLYFGRVFFITVVIACIIAFLLDPMVTAFVKLRLPRAVASFIVCSIALLILYLIGLGLYTQFSGFAEDLPNYSQRMNEIVDNIATRVDQIEKRTYQVVIPKRFQETPPAPRNSAGQRTAAAEGPRKRADPQCTPPAIPEVRIHPEPTPLFTYLYGLRAIVLRRAADGELRSFPGLFHAELARPYAPQFSVSVQRPRPAGRR